MYICKYMLSQKLYFEWKNYVADDILIVLRVTVMYNVLSKFYLRTIFQKKCCLYLPDLTCSISETTTLSH